MILQIYRPVFATDIGHLASLEIAHRHTCRVNRAVTIVIQTVQHTVIIARYRRRIHRTLTGAPEPARRIARLNAVFAYPDVARLGRPVPAWLRRAGFAQTRCTRFASV